MVAQTHDIPPAADFARSLAALPEDDRRILDAFLNLRASISALARHYNWPIADIVAWMQREDIRAILRGIAHSAEDALRIRAALARQTAIDTLEQAALAARTAEDQRRAGAALARACQPASRSAGKSRWGGRPRPPSTTPDHIPAHTPDDHTTPDPGTTNPGETNPYYEPPTSQDAAAPTNEHPAGNHTSSAQSRIEQSELDNLTPRQIVAILTEALAAGDADARSALSTFATPDYRIEPDPQQTGDNGPPPDDSQLPAHLPSLKGARFETPIVLEESEHDITISITALIPSRTSENHAASPIHLTFHFHRHPGPDPPFPWRLTRLTLHTSGP